MKAAILRRYRTDEAKRIRRLYGDNSGMCRFSDRYLYPALDGVSNTITTVLKDNLLMVVCKRR